ncbi:DUF4132 domain-containing protein [Nonomuraea sp. LPB2021202275-12-8]|uniref:DUF4132 domain-containing protein n=1 Tax=Nonomuraea sp. LPB2021202275-12-8 TaxID=3120159 RepID=UPI00300D8D30
MTASLDDLIARDRAMDDLPLTAHDQRQELRRQAEPVRRAVIRELADADGDACRRAAAGLARLSADDYTRELAVAVHRADGWTAAELAELFTAVGRRGLGHTDVEWVCELAGRIRELGVDERRELWRPVEALLRSMREGYVGGEDSRRMQRALARANPSPLALPLAIDPWGKAVRGHLGEAPGAHLVELVDHLSEAGGPRPTKTWRRRCTELLAGAGAAELVAAALDALLGLPRHDSLTHVVMTEANLDVARGVAWAAALAEGAGIRLALTEPAGAGTGVAPALEELVLIAAGHRGRVTDEARLASAAINALGECEGAVETLRRLQHAIKGRTQRKQIDTVLATAAGSHGLTAAQLVERAVPGHGLAAGGTREWRRGEWTVTLAIEDARTVRITARHADGRTKRGLPTGLDGADEIKAVAKQVRQTLSAERARLEALFAVERCWPHDEWARHYRDHPITGAIAGALIWRAADGTAFLPRAGGRVLDGDVRLWHPAGASPEEVRAWRETVAELRLRQPFKQAYREVYLLTPAEEESAGYSNRFAAHLCDHSRLYALAKERGWRSTWLGGHFGGHEADARKELAEGAWRVRFRYERAHADATLLAATDRVRFERRAGRQWRPAALAEVPKLVFSEAMRDIDLFVAVTSIGTDPDWSDRGDGRERAYWREVSQAELPPSAQVRRDALERILPRTTLAGRCTLTDRHLVVRGDLRTYKIHLGSANIFMDPGDVYLCIVGGKTPGKVFLPFEEDGRLSLILSKAFLLAQDTKITDESILRQIKPPNPL